MTIILIIIIGVLLFVLKDKIFGDGKSSAGNKTTYFPPSNSYSVPSKTIAPKLSVWQKFRKKNPQEAAEIETVSEINMDELDDKAAEELIFTFQYWAKKSGCSIIDLKQDFYDKSEAVFELLRHPRLCCTHTCQDQVLICSLNLSKHLARCLLGTNCKEPML